VREVRTGLTLPIFGDLADPVVVAGLASRAEAAGFDGVFVWDHVQYRRDPDGAHPHGTPDLPVADPWVTLAAMAAATSRVRIGPLVTPLPRRRPQVLARQVTSLDVLSAGRTVLGIGLGGDTGREFSAFGDEVDPRVRGAMLDDALALLHALWSGEPVDHDGPHHVARDVQFLPRPVQRPHPPVWAAGRWPNRAPLRRAAGCDGYFPIDLAGPDELAEAVSMLAELRDGDVDGFDVVAQGMPGDDPAPWVAAGATWWLTTFRPWGVTTAEVDEVIAAGPAT